MDAKQAQELKEHLTQLKQLAAAYNGALKHSSPQLRAALQHQGFTKDRRIVLQRFSYILTQACNLALSRLA
jgi:hypothetical protein